MGVFSALKYVLWPTSKAGYATYATIGAAGVATTVGVMKHKRAVEAVRKAKQRRNYGVAAAGGFAALAAAGYFGKQAYDYKNSGQDHEFATSSELADEAPVSGTPSGTTKASSGAQGKTKRKKGKQTDEETPWLLIGFLIVLALAVVGGAVYYFLVMNEEGSDGLPPP